jgi:hypothetical protein
MSGKTRVGVTWTDTDADGDASMASHQQSSFSVSISETTDSGIKIATGFDLTDESDGATDSSGLTLTFTSGAKLDLIEAGNAYASHLASVPGASGEQSGGSGSTGFNAPSGLDYADMSDTVGFELHSAADAFGVEGLKGGISASFNGDASSTSSASAVENSFSVGASYVTTAGDSTVTIGGGWISAEDVATKAKSDSQSTAVAISAVTGNLTVGAGYASGGYNQTEGTSDQAITSADVTTAGAKYVSGDMTFALGYVSGEGTDSAIDAAGTGSADTHEATSASVDYVVASGVTATIGYTDVSRADDGTKGAANSGTGWYIGANVSF